MKLYYNGVNLGIVQVIEDLKVAEYDPTGQDYLWTRYRIAVECLYTPDDPSFGVSYTTAETGPSAQPDPTAAPVVGRNSPVYTDRALRHTLMQPRGVLIVDYNSALGCKSKGADTRQIWLESPPTESGVCLGNVADPTRRPCDMKNGPLPQEDTVVRAIGDGRTFFVRFVVETYLNECRPDDQEGGTIGGLPPPPLLSNRWTATMTYDEGGYATRSFAGLAIFRADALQAAREGRQPYWAPDAWRLAVLPPVPVNSVRYVDQIQQSPDGFSYAYTVRDVEQEVTYLDQPVNVVNGVAVADRTRRPRNVRAISCDVVKQFQTVGTKQAMPEFLNSMQQAAWGFGGGSGGKGSALTAAATTAVARSLALANTFNTLLPTYSETAVCTVRGTRTSTKTGLMRLAFAVAFGQLSGPLGRRVVKAETANEIVNSQTPGAEQARITVEDALKSYTRLTLPAVTLQVRYDAFRRQVQVTVAQEYGGLLDWVTGATAGGLQSLVQNIPEEVQGGNWPFYLGPLAAILNVNLNSAMSPAALDQALGVRATLPLLQDATNLIGTTQDGPGLDIPLAAPPPSPNLPLSADLPLPPSPLPYSPPRQGTQLFNVIAQSLLGPCGEPADYSADRTSSFRQNGKPPAP